MSTKSVDSPDFSEHAVRLLGWDLKGFPSPLKKWLKVAHSVDQDVPERLLHVGVAVYNRFYHFNPKGVQITFEIPPNKRSLDNGEIATSLPQQEFEAWLTESTRNKFNSQTYDPIENNCIDFALDACKYLKVPFDDGVHTHLNRYLKENERVKSVFPERAFTFFFGQKRRTFVDAIDSEDNAEDDEAWEILG